MNAKLDSKAALALLGVAMVGVLWALAHAATDKPHYPGEGAGKPGQPAMHRPSASEIEGMRRMFRGASPAPQREPAAHAR